MKHTEFWQVLDHVFPAGRGRALAVDLSLPGLENLTPSQALQRGYKPLQIWQEIVKEMDLPPEYVFLHRKIIKPKS